MWTNEEISQFQIDNNKALAEINATLKPDVINPSSRIGIFLPGQSGDCGTATAVLKYKNELWPNSEIIWFANSHVADMLRFSNINEVRPWPWAGNGLKLGTPDFWPLLMNQDNRLNKEISKQYELTKDLEDGYFPAPYMLPPAKRHGIDYPNCSKKVFGISNNAPWHPVLNYSDEERVATFKFIEGLPHDKIILFETFAGSGQSILSEEMITDTMNICREKWTNCVFVFASHKYLRGNEKFPEHFFDQQGVYSCAHFTVRQCGLIGDLSDLIISVSSGIMVACSAWGLRKAPVIQFCGSEICSTKSLANGSHFELVTADDKSIDDGKKEFEEKLISLLEQHK